MRLQSRIGIGYSVVMAAMGVVTLVVLFAFAHAHAENRKVHDNYIPSLEIANQLLIQLEHMENAEYLYFAPGQDPEVWLAAFDERAAAFESWYVQAKEVAQLPEEGELYAEIGRLYGAYRHIDQRMRALLAAGEGEAGRRLNATESLTVAQALHVAAQRFHDINLQESRAARDAEEQGLLLSGAAAAFFALFGALMAGVLWYRTSQEVVAPLVALERATATVGETPFEPVAVPEAARTEELTRLQAAFNEMALRLEAATAALRASNQNLEDQVADRTQALKDANTRLTASVEELRTLDKLKSDFLAVMSHELLTPINFVSGYGSALEDGLMGELTPEQTKAVCRMLEGTERLTRMVRNVLDYTQLESDRLYLAPRPMALGPAIEAAIDRVRRQDAQRALRIDEDVPGTLPRLEADPDRVEQIVFELLDNAVKFTSEGHRIRVRAWEEEDAVAMSVEDAGSGIPPEALSEIFKPFYQVDFSRTRAHGGMGLGLALVKHLVEKQHGTLAVRSRLGEGTTVEVRLPKA